MSRIIITHEIAVEVAWGVEHDEPTGADILACVSKSVSGKVITPTATYS